MVIQRRFGGDDQHFQQGIERDNDPGEEAVEIGVQIQRQVKGKLGQHVDLCEQQQGVPVVIAKQQRHQQLHRYGQCHSDQQPQQLTAPLIAFVQHQTAILHFGSVIAVVGITLMHGTHQIVAGLGKIKQYLEGFRGIIGPFQRMVGAVPPFLQEIVAVCILIGCESLPDGIVTVPGAVIAVLPAPFGLVVGAVGFILGEQGAVNRTFRQIAEGNPNRRLGTHVGIHRNGQAEKQAKYQQNCQQFSLHTAVRLLANSINNTL